MQAVLGPVARSSASVTPITCALVARPVVVLSPSWPFAFAPQHVTTFPRSRAHVYMAPGLIVARLVRPVTATGALGFPAAPVPSSPLAFTPQHTAVLSDSSEHACLTPALTDDGLVMPATVTGDICGGAPGVPS